MDMLCVVPLSREEANGLSLELNKVIFRLPLAPCVIPALGREAAPTFSFDHEKSLQRFGRLSSTFE